MKFYPLKDVPLRAEQQALGFEIGKYPWVNPLRNNHIAMMATKTGEKRPPQKGEWFLSGAIPEAYRAKNDFDTPYLIMKLVRVKTTLVTELD